MNPVFSVVNEAFQPVNEYSLRAYRELLQVVLLRVPASLGKGTKSLGVIPGRSG